MAISVAALKLARVAVVGASMILVLTPIRNEKLLQSPPAAEKVPQDDPLPSLKWASMLTTALYLLMFSAYPIVVLVLLTRPSARAAVAKTQVVGDL